MACDPRCQRRILFEDCVSLSELVSLDSLRSMIKPDQLQLRCREFLASCKLDEVLRQQGSSEDAFTFCVAVLFSGEGEDSWADFK